MDLVEAQPKEIDAMTPQLIAALGTQRERYQTAHEVQCYSGIAPVVVTSGKQRWVHWRWACPKFLRQTFHEWAPSLDRLLAMGARILPGEARQEEVPPYRDPSAGIQMDSHLVS